MTTLDNIIAQKLGALVIENAKQAVVIETMKAEIAKRDELLRKLNEALPELPLRAPAEAQKIEATNGQAH